MHQSKRDIAIILANRANADGNIKIKDHKTQNHVLIHRSQARIVTSKNGQKMIEAKSPHGPHRIYRIIY